MDESIVAIELPALTPAAEPDVVREIRAETDREFTNPTVHVDDDSTARYEGHENDMNNAGQDNGEPIHVTLEEIRSSKINDPVAVTEDEAGNRDFNVNIAEKPRIPVSNKVTDASDSEYCNVTFYDRLNRKGKSKSKDTNIDQMQEYAEINVRVNRGNEQKETSEAPEVRPRLPVSNKDTDTSNSEYYNVNHYDNLNRKDKNKSKDTNTDKEYAEVNIVNEIITDKKEIPRVPYSNKDTDASDSEYYNVTHYDKLMRNGKNKCIDTNIDQEYAEIHFEENKDNDQKETAKAPEASANVEVQYAAIDKNRKRKKGGTHTPEE